jgi:hypothetical protein
LQRTWTSPIYSFFSRDVSIQYHDNRMCHFFPCASRKCKGALGGVRRFQDTKDRNSTANLKHHAKRCFGEDAVNIAIHGSEAKPSATVFSLFARPGQKPVRYSHRNLTDAETR